MLIKYHEAMTRKALSERRERFEYALEAAVKRAQYGFDKTVTGLSRSQDALFTDSAS